MAVLKFAITPTASAQFHGAISCLSRFNDAVSIEAREDQLSFSALNSSKSAHAVITFDLPFFIDYEFVPPTLQLGAKFTCSITNKALLSIFKSRSSDAKSSNALEKCEIAIQDGTDAAKCRLVAKNICSNGVIKTFKLTYEAADVMHALFDKSAAVNKWSIKASFLKENLDYFSPKVEQLDIYHIEDKMTFLSFTEKIVTAKNEILKQPLKTTVMLNAGDFDSLDVQQELHIVISVKDFRAIILHADIIDATVRAAYSVPGRPLQFQYTKGAMDCQFTLMTAGEYKGPLDRNGKPATPKKSQQPQQSESPSKLRQQTIKVMPPPPRPMEVRRNTKTLGRRQTQETTSSKGSEPLFVEQDDNGWDPPNYEEQEETLGWNPDEETESLYTRRLRDREEQNQTNAVPAPQFPHVDALEGSATQEIVEPTQRLSEIPRLW